MNPSSACGLRRGEPGANPAFRQSRLSALQRRLGRGLPLVLLLVCSSPIRMTAQDATGPVYDPQPMLPDGSGSLETRSLQLERWPADGNLRLRTPASNFVAIWLQEGRSRAPLRWRFNADASSLVVEAGARPPSSLPATVLFESAERTAQFADGRIVFSALDATVEGRAAKLESHPGNHRIGFWTDPNDVVSWRYKPTRWGRYDVELAGSANGGAGTELEVEIAGQTLRARRPSTESWYRYTTWPVGRVYVAKADPLTVRVRCSAMQGGAVMNLKAVIWRPAPEGEPIVQEATGLVVLRAHDAVTHSTVMRYEPATNKNCLGYWVNPRDWAEWEFMLAKPGTFEVEVWQGCGRGNGGSDVRIEAAEASLSFKVEDTGHFQNFVPRRVGRVKFGAAGLQTLAVRPVRKQAAAVMDVREIRLVPVGPEKE